MTSSRTTRPFLEWSLNLAASIQVAWFYVAYVPSGLNLLLYEQGQERTPFQQRLLLMYPLRWAHQSAFLNRLAYRLTAMPAWFPHGVRPEGLAQAAIDLGCIVVTGLVARSLYRAASTRKLLTPYVFPLTLLMVMATYCLNTMHRLRFVFDLPSMALFAVGMALLYFKRSDVLFVIFFVIGTINRETTLFLLLLLILRRWVELVATQEARPWRSVWRSLGDVRTTGLILSLAVFWICWHVGAIHHFHGNLTAAGPRFWLNIGTLLWPTSWAQILCTFAFCGPLCIAGRRLIQDRVLRAWFVVVPVWGLFMLRYGILIETRVFGELIPYFACVAVLIAEQNLLRRITAESCPSSTASA